MSIAIDHHDACQPPGGREPTDRRETIVAIEGLPACRADAAATPPSAAEERPSSFDDTLGFRAAIAPALPQVVRYARRLTGSTTEADDLVQDTLMRAWAARSSFEPGTNLTGWLMTIARNRFRSNQRRGGRQTAWDPEVMERILVTPSDQETGLMMEDLRKALGRLPQPQRSAFDAVVLQGQSYRLASHNLGISSGALKSRVTRARAALVGSMDRSPTAASMEPRSPCPPSMPPGARYAAWKRSGSPPIGGG